MKRLTVFFALLLLASALEYEKSCFKITLPNLVQVKRGESTTFDFSLQNIVPNDNQLDNVKVNYLGELEAGYLELSIAKTIKWKETGKGTLTIPFNAEEGYRNVIINATSKECGEPNQGLFVVQILRGDELSLHIEPETFEIEQGKPKVLTLTVQNKGPETINITLTQSGVLNSILDFQPKKLSVGAESSSQSFITVNTSTLDYKTHKMVFSALSNIEGLNATANASLTVIPNTLAEQKRQEKYAELATLRKSFDLARQDVPDSIALETENAFIKVAKLLDEQNVGQAATLLEELSSLEAKGWTTSAQVDLTKPQEVNKTQDLLSKKNLVKFQWEIRPFIPLINLGVLVGLIVLFIHTRLSSMVEIVKSAVRYEEGNVKVRITIVNHSPLPLQKLVLKERLPKIAKLDSTFKVNGKEKRFKMENTVYTLDLGTLGPGKEFKIEYELMEFVKHKELVEFMPADLNFSFFKKFKIKSNEPIA